MNLEERLNGKLPEIDIAGTMFYVDLRLRELRADYTLQSHINLDLIEQTAGGYRFAFDTTAKKICDIDSATSPWPEHIVMVELPDDLVLDPYAVARDAGLDIVKFVKQYPIAKELTATIIPLHERNVQKLTGKETERGQTLLPKKNHTRQQKKGRGM